MRRLFQLAAAVALTSLLAGCAFPKTPISPPRGVLFSRYKAPLTPDLHNTPVGTKQGKVKTFFVCEPFLGTMWAWEDASIKTAAAHGHLSHVYYAAYEALALLGLFGRFTVIAYGD